MNLDLQDQTAVIVGGGSGIGRGIAQAFADEGARVAIWDRAAGVGAVAEEIAAQSGRKAIGICVDATDYPAVRKGAEEVHAALGQPRHVVYAAGMGSGKFGFPFWNLDPADWDRVLRVNLLGAVHTAHALAPAMAKAGEGTFLFISSIAGQIGSQTDPPYSAAKGALINFAMCAAKDLAPHNVRVNTICPGMIQTPLNRSVWQAWHDAQPAEKRQSYDQWAGSKVKAVCPLGRWQEPEDVAALAVFLASERAKNITGQTMNVDGGWIMHW